MASATDEKEVAATTCEALKVVVHASGICLREDEKDTIAHVLHQ
jgi:hypothetical protein